MTVTQVLWLVAAIVMAISAFVEPPRVTLYKIAWALFLLGLVFMGGDAIQWSSQP